MQMSKGDCVLHLSEHYGDCCPGAAMRIETDELEAFQEAFQEALAVKRYKMLARE